MVFQNLDKIILEDGTGSPNFLIANTLKELHNEYPFLARLNSPIIIANEKDYDQKIRGLCISNSCFFEIKREKQKINCTYDELKRLQGNIEKETLGNDIKDYLNLIETYDITEDDVIGLRDNLEELKKDYESKQTAETSA